MNYWTQATSNLIHDLHSDEALGLSESSLVEAKKKYGDNLFIEEKKKSLFWVFCRQFNNSMSYVLICAALISLILGEEVNTIAIFAIVLLNGLISFAQESKAESSMAALKQLSTPKAKVIRDGKIKTVPSTEVYPGDILSLEAGDYIVADALIINSFQLSADEATLSGESLPTAKSPSVLPSDTLLAERSNMLHAGTAMTTGSAQAIVVATGINTEIGKIAKLLKKTVTETTPLQKRLAVVGNKLLLIGAAIMLITTILGIIHGRDWLTIFMFATSLAIAAIPEGLPTIVTLALALAVKRMTKRNVIVRKLSAVETLGSTDIICTDKTGTLTTGDMVVRDTYLLDENDRPKLLQAIFYCNNASLDNGGSGDPTEIALLRYAGPHPPLPNLYEWSFDSDRKRMSVAIKIGSEIEIFCKGALESIILFCKLSPEQEKEIQSAMKSFSSKGQRILAVASRTLIAFDANSPLTVDKVESELQFLGLVSMADPPKGETLQSIAACQAAGIKIIMITGDHPLTAEAIARELGIIRDEKSEIVMTGSELKTLSMAQLRKRSEKNLVYARTSPEDKLKIVEALQANGHTVAMTGDGVNDAPALKKASIGVAMGKAGTEVARQASSMILTDDNFSTIVSAIEEGRAIYGNIKRTIQYLLSTNLAELLIVLGSSAMGLPIPFVPLGLLWINLATDGLPSIALASEPLEKNSLKGSIAPSPKSFFDKGFMMELVVIGLMMTIIEMVTYTYMLKRGDITMAKSYAFNLLIYLVLFRSFSCRSETRTYFQMKFNALHLLSVLLPIVFQIGLGELDWFQRLIQIGPITIKEHLLLMGLGMIPVVIIETKKLVRSGGSLK